MKKIYQLTFVLFIFSVFALSYPVTQVFAQGGGQCDSNPACNPASGTCCGQCDSNPACNPNDPNGIPCCSSGINNMSSGTLPPRIPAPSGHDKMNHENRRPSGKKHLPEGEELRDAFKGCLNELEFKDRQLQNASQPKPRSSQPPAQCAPDPGKVSLCSPHRIFPAEEELGLRQLLYNLGIMTRPETGPNMDKLLHIARKHREYCQQGD